MGPMTRAQLNEGRGDVKVRPIALGPNWTPAVPEFVQEWEGAVTEGIILPAAVYAANQSVDIENIGQWRGAFLYLDVTAVPGIDTVTAKIRAKYGATYVDILAAAARVGIGADLIKAYPGLTAAANLVANDVLPRNFNFQVVHSAGSNFTYSARIVLLR